MYPTIQIYNAFDTVTLFLAPLKTVPRTLLVNSPPIANLSIATCRLALQLGYVQPKKACMKARQGSKFIYHLSNKGKMRRIFSAGSAIDFPNLQGSIGYVHSSEVPQEESMSSPVSHTGTWFRSPKAKLTCDPINNNSLENDQLFVHIYTQHISWVQWLGNVLNVASHKRIKYKF